MKTITHIRILRDTNPIQCIQGGNSPLSSAVILQEGDVIQLNNQVESPDLKLLMDAFDKPKYMISFYKANKLVEIQFAQWIVPQDKKEDIDVKY